MIVNPPRSENELSPRLRAISIHALDKNPDPDDRPPLLSAPVRRWVIILSVIGCTTLGFRGSLWLVASSTIFQTQHSQLADYYRQLARNTEATARPYRAIVKSGKSAVVAGFPAPVDPISAKALISQAEKQVSAFLQQAANEERAELGLPVR